MIRLLIVNPDRPPSVHFLPAILVYEWVVQRDLFLGVLGSWRRGSNVDICDVAESSDVGDVGEELAFGGDGGIEDGNDGCGRGFRV